MIQNIDTGFPKVLKPGLIECTLDICEELTQLHQKQFVLSFDGRQVALGLKESVTVMLIFGVPKKTITNEQACNIQQLNMDIVQSLESPININNQIVQSTHLKRLLYKMPTTDENTPDGEYFAEHKLEKLKDQNPDKVDRLIFI